MMDYFLGTLHEVEPTHAKTDEVLVNLQEKNCYHKKQQPIKVILLLQILQLDFNTIFIAFKLTLEILNNNLVLESDKYV